MEQTTPCGLRGPVAADLHRAPCGPPTETSPPPHPSAEPVPLSIDFAIKGFLETSFLDWPGRLAAVVFLGGCNFRCPFCHNAELVLEPQRLPSIPLEAVLGRLRALRGWVDGIVVSGGEPTISPRLPELLRRIRAEGFEVKLDTNGSCPDVLAKLIARGLVQAIDMDVKAPLEPALYAALAGVPVRVELVRASVDLIRLSGLPHRFRTTYVPGLLDHAAIGRLRASTPPGSAHVLQGFNPKRVLDPGLRCVAAPTAEEMLMLGSGGNAALQPVSAAC
ncbi:MAG: anaerobic ribonucleoside-triphosphate reductase activating protein [Candidatus Methylomirabilia bacterium]